MVVELNVDLGDLLQLGVVSWHCRPRKLNALALAHATEGLP
jgi:hypothetical protein